MRFFGQNLRYLLAIRGESQKELAVIFGLSKSQVSNYTNDISYPTMELAFKICEYYKLGLDDLFRRDLRPTESPPEIPPPKLHPVSDGDTEGASQESAVRAVAVGLKQPAAAESPPPLQGEDIRKMRQDLLQMMVKLEAVEMAGSNFDK